MHGQLKFKSETRTLGGNVTLTAQSPTLQLMDPGGSGRTITLPAEADSDGLCFIIGNRADAAEVLTIQDDGSATICTPTQNETAMVFCDGTSWIGLVGADS